ncbi:hypothetical protein [Methylobacterium sp. WL120]|uniref:hypothetical protein n=1 Tax=Methylobacterium sp. WL120 TaxID=2603887 RepID=UPI0011CBD64B|nr:hypothetical protein [Methylobacterium sp. WL120]TXM69664.1 hypothetical protein FV229_04785 [Methylobacterium sp. WL120]
MIDVNSYLVGLGSGLILAITWGVLTIGLVRSELRRVRTRLAWILEFARRQDVEWTRRRMTGNDWNDLIEVIQPYDKP